MSEPAPHAESSGGPPEEGGSLRNMLNALVSPREAFESIARQPTTAIVLIVLVLLGVVAVHVAMTRVTPEAFLASLESMGRELPPEAKEDPERLYKVTLWSQSIGALVVSPIFYFAMAGSFLVLFRLLGSEITFRQSLSTSLHGVIPLGVAAVVGTVVALGREEVSLEELQSGSLLMSHLGFLAGEEAGKVTRALFSSFDLFSAWCVALLATGYRIVARVSAGAAWTVVLALWVVGVLCKLALTAAF